MNANELRVVFREYMAQQGYEKKEADSLVSSTFPTCFTVSGGPNFLDQHFQQCEFRQPENKAVIQPCHRFWDVPLVGDGKHLSAFEMAVTYSFDGQSREEMFTAHFNFLTRELGLDPSKFKVTLFGGGRSYGFDFASDDEARRIWESLGVKNFTVYTNFKQGSHSQRLANENFVANVIEPFGGPRTEVFYDGVEIWTSVKYSTRVEHKPRFNIFYFHPYDYPTFAAGFGLERVLSAVNGLSSIDKVFTSQHTDSPVVYDHVRGLVQLAHDGAFSLPRRKDGHSQRGRITVLNRYVRNLFQHLSVEDAAQLSKIVGEAITVYGSEQPALQGKADSIVELIRARATRLGL